MAKIGVSLQNRMRHGGEALKRLLGSCPQKVSKNKNLQLTHHTSAIHNLLCG